MSQMDMMELREELAARDIEWSGDWDNNGMTTSWESLDGQHFQCFQRGWNGNLAIIIRDVTPEQAIVATLGSEREAKLIQAMEDVLRHSTDTVWAGEAETLVDRMVSLGIYEHDVYEGARPWEVD